MQLKGCAREKMRLEARQQRTRTGMGWRRAIA